MGWTRVDPVVRFRRGLRGLGDCFNSQVNMGVCPDGSEYTGALDSGGAASQLSFPYVLTPTPATSVPAGSGTDWTQFWQGLTAGGVKLLGSVVTPPAYQQVTRDAYGNVISTTVRAATPNTALTAAAGGLPAISSNALLIGGGILAVALVAMSMGRGKG